MFIFSKVISSDFDKFKKRIVKILCFGRNDYQTGIQSAPYGIDSNPIKDMVAVYGPSSEKGRTVVVGYLNKNQLAAPGETRLYSTDADGVLKFYTWLKNDGTYEIGGNQDNLIRYAKLNEALQQAVTDINTELGKIATGIAAGGGSYTPDPISLDISQAKIDEVKTS